MDRFRDGLKELLPNNLNLPSPRQLLQIPFFAPLAPQHASSPTLSLSESSCPSPGLSCPITPPTPLDTCCLNYPSGHFLLTQFWDTSPPLGPSESWTIHGLWPDYCTGGFEAFCDKSLSKSPEELTAILSSAASSSHPDLLKYMIRYWLSNDFRNSNLWSHEWNKHGTCISTIEPRCYGNLTVTEATDAAILDYFTHATNLFGALNTHTFLAAQDIVPSSTQTYSLSDLEAAIRASVHGQQVTLRCNSRHELDEIWYHFLIRGSLRNATASSNSPYDVFVPTTPDGQTSNCPQTGVKYLPKGAKPPHQPPHQPTHTSPGHIPTSKPTPFTGRGHLKIHILSNSSSAPDTSDKSTSHGCLIRPGTWYTSGACATYTAKTDIIESHQSRSSSPPENLFTLQSSYAPCAILSPDTPHGHAAEFTCNKKLPLQSIFSSANSSASTTETATVLSYRNQTVFFADRVPVRFEKVAIFADDGDGARGVKVEVHWEGV